MMENKKRLCHRFLSFIDKTMWAIKPDSLEKIISIANRSYSDLQLVAAIKSEQSLSVINTDDIAVIDVIGPIFTRADFFSDISGATSIDTLERRLDEALYDDSIRAIVLRIDSPGGEVTGTHEFANYLDEACEIKPIVAYVSGMACSAAYWIASATSHIYADKTATLGSIGVVAAWTDDSKARTAAGLTDYEVVSSQSPHKRLDPTQDDGRAELQKHIDGLADIFIDDVASFRNVTREKILSNFGQGGTFLADESVKIGMADEISSFRDVIAKLSTETSNINNNGVQTMGVKSKRNFLLNASADDELDQQGADDIENDRESANKKANKKANENKNDLDSANDDDLADEDDDDDLADERDELSEDDDFEDTGDEDENPAAKKAVNALARKQPKLYRAIIKRGARRERNRIASIDGLNIVGHKNLIRRAKYEKLLSAEQTAHAVLRAERSQREKLASDYASDASYRVPTSTNANNQSSVDSERKSFLKNIAAGVMAARGSRSKK